ncbi:photosystem II Psb27 protein [Marchantia polymorpha subsp. ruderalis]|nr:hypothetical protein MARPO_0049s0056 [Marchantia polymorpha]BBN06278.1 hypothetical protein Mp_3g19780 [Marchantia polymorpha subsp. ruderalis]|eukprot:PTQ38765.1 hypothetical protein MARPO_0049s0056 [Marchantia polymorpha]
MPRGGTRGGRSVVHRAGPWKGDPGASNCAGRGQGPSDSERVDGARSRGFAEFQFSIEQQKFDGKSRGPGRGVGSRNQQQQQQEQEMASVVQSTALSSVQCLCNHSLRIQNGAGAAPAMAAFPTASSKPIARLVTCAVQEGAESHSSSDISRREAVLSGVTALIGGLGLAPAAFAEFEEDYKKETQAVIEQVKGTLALEKTDPTKSDAVAALRRSSNDWVAKYRREKSVAGRPSFSNMYSVINAISGHYTSYGPNVAIPVKRKDRIFEEINIAEKALNRGR